jgi:RNA polymerase sigma-B factor
LIDHYRAQPTDVTNVPIDDVPEGALPTVEGTGADLGLEPKLAEALAGLANRDREILALRYGGDLTGPEIADMTGLTLANVQQIISRSLRRLRTVLDA